MNENKAHLVMVTSNSYLQQPGILKQSGEWIGKYGKQAFIVTGQKSWEAAGDRLTGSMEKAGIRYRKEAYRGECSYAEVDRLEELIPSGSDLIIGVGGGKVLDAAKALSTKIGIPLITIPTIAATCAAVTNLSIMYTEDGVYVGFPIFYQNPVLTLVDTEIIAAAPVEHLISGIGDTIAKLYESAASSSGKPLNVPTLAGLQMAKLLYDVLLEHGGQAVSDAKRHEASEALEKVADAVILLSGAVGGFGEENCRSAAAHAVHNGLTVLPESHQIPHGIKVAYGIVVQLMLEERPRSEIDKLLAYYRKIGLPGNLRELGISTPLNEEQLDEVVRIAMLPESTMGMMPMPITPEMVKAAIQRVEDFQPE